MSAEGTSYTGEGVASSPDVAVPTVSAAAVPRIEWGVLVPVLILALVVHLFVAAILLPARLPLKYMPIGEWQLLASLLVGCVVAGTLCVLLSQLLSDMVGVLRRRSVPPLRDRFATLGRLLLSSWVLALIYGFVMIAYVNLKPAIPLLNPMNHDAELEGIERALFGGTLPSEWLVTHSSGGLLAFWDVIYNCFALFLFVSLTITLYFDGLRGGARLVFALFVGKLLDLVITLCYPTMGPIFAHPEWFTGLEGLPSGELAAFLAQTVEEYAKSPGHVYACAGISAMPSYHVYGWTCGFLCWLRLPRWLVLSALVLVILNYISTIALGWHYALDGVVATVLALAMWWAAGRIVPPAVRLPAAA